MGGQIFIKSFAGLVSVYKNTHTGLKCLNINFVMPHNCRGDGGGAFFKIQNEREKGGCRREHLDFTQLWRFDFGIVVNSLYTCTQHDG